MLPCQIEEMTLSKSKFLYDVDRKKNSRFCKQLSRAIFYITFGFISDMNTQNQVQISSINNDATSKKNQVDATNAKEVTK